MVILRKIKATFILLYAILLPSVSQQYNITSFPELQQLSNSYVYTLVQDSGAFLWIGTSDGLFRFDGSNLKKFTTNDSLADNFITCSYLNGDGAWFGHMNGSLSYYNGKTFIKITPNVSENGSITDLSENPDGSIWASTSSKGLLKLDKESCKEYLINNNDFTIFTFRFINNNTLLAGSSDGVRLCKITDKGDLEIIRHFTEIPRERIKAIIKLKYSDEYLIASNNSIYKLLYNNNSYKVITLSSVTPFIINDIQAILEDNKQNIWISSFGEGIYKLKISNDNIINEITRFNSQSGLLSDNIKTIYQDRDENIWAGNYGQGINRLTAQTFSIETFDKIKFGENVKSIVTNNDYKWVATEKGILKTNLISNEVLGFYTLGIPETEISVMYIGPNNDLMIGTNGFGIYKFDTGKEIFEKYALHDGNLENTITAITGQNNYLWVGTKKGACKIDLNTNEKTWYTLQSAGMPHNSVRQIYIDSKQQIWIVTLSNSLSVIRNNKLEKIVIPSGTSNVTLESVAEDNNKNMWISSGGQGIFMIKPDSILNLTTREGLFSDYCYSIINDQQGYIWIGHRNGLSRINCKDLSIKVISKYANINNGNEFNNNSIAIDKYNRILFGFNHGILLYNPSLENKAFLPPVIHLNSININNQDFEPSEKIKLIPGRYKIQFDYIAINLKEPDMVRYQYRLKGYDTDWSEISNNTSATYSGLAEGNYIFEVNASSGDGIVTEKPLRIEIVIKTPLWKSVWMYIISVLFLVALIYLYNNRLQKRHLHERQILEQKVQERTIEIQYQKDEIERQRDLINKKNVDITDSLKYARKIQSSIIPPDELLEKLLPNHFLINKPKDIVSGDFCWYTLSNDKILVTVADCTGHGVPGAMMSILGLNALNEIVINYGITEPSRILEFLRLKVITSLSQHSKDSPSFDGINLGLCAIDQDSQMIQFSGALNNMVHIQDGKLNLVKADRIPIGVSDMEHKPFTNTEFQGKEGDVIYMYTDGFQDQFGGDDDKKFSSKRFIEVLFSIHTLPLHEQQEKLETILNNWMGDNEQTDDITILGFRL